LKSSSLLADQAEVKRLLHEGQDVIVQRLRDQSRPIDVTGIADRLGAAVDERLAAGFGAIAVSLDKSLGQLAESLNQFGIAQSGALQKLDGIASHPLADEMRNLSKSIEAGLSAGFADLSRVLDVIITNQALAATAQDKDASADFDTAAVMKLEEELYEDDKQSRTHALSAFRNALRSSSDPSSDSKN
jgi:NAD(P)-dependent dehydrogenase (short-subunit alcohol dehydrogenase family)